MKNIFYKLQKITLKYVLCKLYELRKLYELCKLYEYFMNHLKSVEIA